MKVAMEVDAGHGVTEVWQIFPLIAMVALATCCCSASVLCCPKQPCLGKRVHSFPTFQTVYPDLFVCRAKLSERDKAATPVGEPETYKHRKKAA
jgi:hypothetical protein